MKIRFSCSECGRLIVADERFAGKRAKCPDCRIPVLVPKKSTASASQKLPPKASLAKKVSDPSSSGATATTQIIPNPSKTSTASHSGGISSGKLKQQNYANPEEKAAAASFSSNIFHSIVATKPKKMSTRVKAVMPSSRIHPVSSEVLDTNHPLQSLTDEEFHNLLHIRKKIYLLATSTIMLVVVGLVYLF